jgi:hypothetical protein
MIATMNVTPERRQTVGILDSSYYASGVNVLAIRKAAFKKWEQLKEQSGQSPAVWGANASRSPHDEHAALLDLVEGLRCRRSRRDENAGQKAEASGDQPSQHGLPP